MRELVEQGDRAARRRELRIGLVEHDDRVPLGSLRDVPDLLDRESLSGGIGGRAQEDDAHVAQGDDVLHRGEIQREPPAVVVERNLDERRVLDPGAHRVHAEAGRGDQDAVDSRAAEGADQQVDAFVAPAGHHQALDGTP